MGLAFTKGRLTSKEDQVTRDQLCYTTQIQECYNFNREGLRARRVRID